MNGADPNSSDTDGDGLPDRWEVTNALDPATDDSGEDPDGDGYSNLQKYRGGSDPHDAASIPSGSGTPLCGTAPGTDLGTLLGLVLMAISRRRRKGRWRATGIHARSLSLGTGSLESTGPRA